MATIFFSYSHKDETLRDQLETHLAMLQRQGFIEAWHDRRITPGDILDQAIGVHLERADIVLLLVSPDFLASDYCYEHEMTRALERHEAGACRIIPVILRPCDWRDAPFGKLLAAPKDGKPITRWPDSDDAFLDVTQAIKSALAASSAARAPRHASASPEASAPAPSATTVIGARSSNLRVSKRFTDHDKDRFLQDAFEFIAKFFENSLAELAKRNPGIDGRFRRIDANRFTAVAYRDGRAVARCAIQLGHRTGMRSGITYSYDLGADGSYNENLSVEHDEQTLYLKPLGVSAIGRGGRQEGKLSLAGGAEFYWELFIEPLQRG